MNVMIVGPMRAVRFRTSVYQLMDHVRTFELPVDEGSSQRDTLRLQHVVAHGDIDVVDIAVPGPECQAWVNKAIEAGIRYVLCTESITLDPEHFDDLVASCRSAGVQLFFRNPLELHYIQLRDWLQNQLVVPGVLRLWRHSLEHEDSEIVPWDSHNRRLFGQDVGFLTWAVGPVLRVYARMASDNTRQSHLTVSLRFTNGIIGHVLHSVRLDALEAIDLEVWSATTTTSVSVSERDTGQGNSKAIVTDEECTSFSTLIEATRSGTEPNFGIVAVRRQVSTLAAIYQSLETRMSVTLDEE